MTKDEIEDSELECDECHEKFKLGEVIIISKSAVVGVDDYEPDGENFNLRHSGGCHDEK